MVEWTTFCEESGYSNSSGAPYACINHTLIICLDALLLITLIFTNSSSSKNVHIPSRFQGFSTLQIVSAILNTCVGVVYLFLGIFILEEKLRKTQTANFPLISLCFQILFQGFTWLLVGLTVSIRVKQLPKAPVLLLSILAFLFSGFVCFLSLYAAVLSKQITLKIALDVLSFPGAIFLLLCSCRNYKCEGIDESGIQNGLYTTLRDESNGVVEGDPVTPFAKAGSLSKFTFWWLDSLMRKGREKTLRDEDIPKLREADRAESCYLLFLEKLDKQKQTDPSSQPSILRAIILCHLKEIFVSGFFALLKIITVSAGPLLLNAFILVAEGKDSYKYEGYVLAISLLLAKITESLSQRQWYFRTRLIGMKVRSLLIAAIYKKQLRLSNAAKLMHSNGEIMNYVSVDAYRIGELPFWFHQTWTTSLQLCIALVILYQAVGQATIAALVVIILTVIGNAPFAKQQQKFQTKLMVAQDDRLKASSEALLNMKVLKLYAWETHFKSMIEKLRNVEYKWLLSVQLSKAKNAILFWTSPVLVSTATFGACYFLKVPLHANNVFTFVATLSLVQQPISSIPDVLAVIIQSKVSFARIINFLEAPELQTARVQLKCNLESVNHNIIINSADFSWEENLAKPSLRNIDVQVGSGKKVAVCGEVGSGKSTLLAAILGEVPNIRGNIHVYGKIAYVSQTAWIQTGTIQDNILFGSPMDDQRYHETLERCSLLKDLDLLPYGDLTEIGERGVNLSGGQKQRIQLARALYQNADIYLLDDPFSAVDAHTASSLFDEYVVEGLSGKTVLLVTHQVDFLPAVDSVLLMFNGEILREAPYHQLLSTSQEFQDLVNAHKKTAGSERIVDITPTKNHGASSARKIRKSYVENQFKPSKVDQFVKQEEREEGDMGLKPYKQYLSQNKGFLYFSIAVLCHITFLIGQIAQNCWMAANVENPYVSLLKLIMVYLVIGFATAVFFLFRCFCMVVMGVQSSKSLFLQLQNSLFSAPISFYDSTPLGRILSRVSLDMSIVDIDVPWTLTFAAGACALVVANLGVLAAITWQVLFVSVPTIYLALQLQCKVQSLKIRNNQKRWLNGLRFVQNPVTRTLVESHMHASSLHCSFASMLCFWSCLSSQTHSHPKMFTFQPGFKAFLQIVSAISNTCLGFIYLFLGISILEDKLRKNQTVNLPLSLWFQTLFHGFTWLFAGLTVSIRVKQLPKAPLQLLSILAFLFSGNYKYEGIDESGIQNGLYTPLTDESNGVVEGDPIITTSAGPLLLNAFILVAEGKESFKYEGYVLAITLFLTKSVESLSQGQWYFRTRLIGMKVRSLLTAAIYKKQLRLSNAVRLMHSGGEIMNYVTVDAYRSTREYNILAFWSFPILVSGATFGACCFLNVPLHASNVFTFLATLNLIQDLITSIPDVIGVIIQSKVGRSKKVAVCGEVGSGKSTLLAAILGEIPKVRGNIQVYGKIAYVSQTAWIQIGTVQDNILFGSAMDGQRYQETLERCSLVKELDLLPHGDLTEIGERGVNLSGGQKQRIQLARALYQNADIYLLDDPISAVDAHTATNLFNNLTLRPWQEYVMEGLSGKTVLLATHQVDFLHAFDSVLLMSDGEILRAAPYHQLLSLSQEFQDLVNAHNNTAGPKRLVNMTPAQNHGTSSARKIRNSNAENEFKPSKGDQLIKQEERETGHMRLKAYKQYLSQDRGYLYFSIAMLSQFTFTMSQIAQNSWMAANVDNPLVSSLMLIMVYLVIGLASTMLVLFRSLCVVVMGVQSSKSIFSQLLNSLFNAPMSFYDSTPLGRILSRVSIDISLVDIDIPFSLIYAAGAFISTVAYLGVVAVITWQVLLVSVPTIYLALRLQISKMNEI
ncbi:hypothetical protein FEM48_Zijuj03G0168100 [Ziziphus jujuba var. spinosa]|uniref:ABC-type xenobiotic transporter n=1 Tax=Ziziphus jujuba var. spinosa TaxID=714518 RepID=A0A978VRH1_ZIZJJ|nr:hypothetical protein FEM48_Zijuj03G0168100 [Ziziphus jujuba var. spinosa]